MTSGLCRSCSATKTYEHRLIYTHVLNRGGLGVKSPMDSL